MSSTSRNFAAILLLLLVAVEFGGGSLLAMLTRRIPGYLDNPLRQNMFRAGHAHAGVWVVFALVALLWVDQTDLGEPLKWVVRLAFAVAPILMPLGFFLSVTRPDAERPNAVITLVYAGGLALAVGALTLGVGLLISG
jgi:heme/copper-type cytochrome/quinol oxidase subunit 4